MVQDTQPAALDTRGEADPWAPFRVGHAEERMRLLRELRDCSVPVILSAPHGVSLTTTLWALDAAQGRLNFSVDPDAPAVQRLVDAGEATAVAYLAAVKLQFEIQGLLLVRSAQASALQGSLPREVYRFQRRSAYRVRPQPRREPVVRFRHPALPDMALTLRVVDISIGGCALWLPTAVPPLQAGTRLGELRVELDADNHFAAPATLQHVSSLGQPGAAGVRLGCEWQPLSGAAERVLQRWIDRAQQRQRLLTLG